MTWLMTHMWTLLAIAALLAFLFGLGLRGWMLRGRMRRAEVDSELKAIEIGQLKEENDALYAAQTKLSAAQSGIAPAALETSAESPDHAATIRRLRDEVAALEAQLASRPEPASGDGSLTSGAIGAVIGAAGAAAVTGDDGELKAENAKLIERITALEAERDAALAQTEAAPVAVPVVAGGDVETDKLRWQNDYLRTRLKVFEQNAGVQLTGDLPDSQEEAPPADTGIDGPELEPRETPDEELARLRWRNRYLEGRLAYLEEEREEADDPDMGAALGVVALAGGAAAATAGVLGSNDSDEPVSITPDDEMQEAPLEAAQDEVAEILPEPVEDIATSLEAVEDAVSDEVGNAAEAVSETVEAGFDEVSETIEAAETEVSDIAEETATVVDDEIAAAIADAPMETVADATEPEDAPETGSVEVDDVSAAVAQMARDTAPSEDNNIAGQIEAAEPVESSAEEALIEETEPEPAEDVSAESEPEAEPDPEAVPDEMPAPRLERPDGIDAARDGEGDNLTQIDGVGPRIQDVLNSLGIFHFDQVAAWSPENAAWVDDYLSFDGRVTLQDWVGQARTLAGAPQSA